MKKIISIVVLISIFINLSLFGIPRINKVNLFGPKAVYAQEEISEPARWVVLVLLLLYLLYKNIPTEVPVVSPFARPSIAPFKIEERVAVSKAYQLDNAWKITLDSYKLLTGGAIEFNFLVENIQDKVAKATIGTQETVAAGYTQHFTYLLDSGGNKYKDVYISKPGEREYIPNIPVEIKVIFPNLKQDIKVFILYLGFSGSGYEGKELFFGPIK